MRDLFNAILLIGLFALLGLFIKVNADFAEYQSKVEVEKYDNEKRLEKMEKEIRILKTDLYLNVNGFEGGNE